MTTGEDINQSDFGQPFGDEGAPREVELPTQIHPDQIIALPTDLKNPVALASFPEGSRMFSKENIRLNGNTQWNNWEGPNTLGNYKRAFFAEGIVHWIYPGTPDLDAPTAVEQLGAFASEGKVFLDSQIFRGRNRSSHTKYFPTIRISTILNPPLNLYKDISPGPDPFTGLNIEPGQVFKELDGKQFQALCRRMARICLQKRAKAGLPIERVYYTDPFEILKQSAFKPSNRRQRFAGSLVNLTAQASNSGPFEHLIRAAFQSSRDRPVDLANSAILTVSADCESNRQIVASISAVFALVWQLGSKRWNLRVYRLNQDTTDLTGFLSHIDTAAHVTRAWAQKRTLEGGSMGSGR